jgi:molecular chaperone GrpE
LNSEHAASSASQDIRAAKHLCHVLDSVQRAIEQSPDASSAFHVGYERIRDQLDQALIACGVARFGQPGDRFDPHIHEAIATAPHTPHPSDHVAQVTRHGLRTRNGQLIQTAKVVVSV